MSNNQTHRSRLARSFALESGLPYQAALARVVGAAEAGQLPLRLDGAGLRQALDTLRAQLDPSRVNGLAPRYYRLSEVLGDSVSPTVARWVARARAAGVMTLVEESGCYDPVDDLSYTALLDDIDDDDVDWDEFDEDELDEDRDPRGLAAVLARGPDWLRRVLMAGARPECELPSPYSLVGDLPIDLALDDRDATGDLEAYEEALQAILEDEPRDVDAFAHMGNLLLDMADGTGEVIVTPRPPARLRRTLASRALEYYQGGVGVGELCLPDPFTGVLRWGRLDNRPFFRALHGLALALWQLRRFDAAEMVLLNMLWLNPNDNQGARIILPDVQAHRRREDFEEP